MGCLGQGLVEPVTALLFTGEHRRRFCSSNLLDWMFREIRWRTKVVPRFTGKRACLTFLCAVFINITAPWRGGG